MRKDNSLVRDCVLVTDDQKLFPMHHELSYVFAEQRKGGLVTTMSAFSKRAMHSGLRKSPPGYRSLPFNAIRAALFPLEEEFNVGHVCGTVAVFVFHVIKYDGERPWLLALTVPLVVLREQGALPCNGEPS